MSKKWLKWIKDVEKGKEESWSDEKKQKEMENFAKWLEMFYKSNKNEKNLIMYKLALYSEPLYKFVDSVKDLNKEQQEILCKQIRGEI